MRNLPGLQVLNGLEVERDAIFSEDEDGATTSANNGQASVFSGKGATPDDLLSDTNNPMIMESED